MLRFRQVWLFLPLWILAIFLPSANFQVFDGVPLGTIAEFAALVILMPLVASRGLRRLISDGVLRRWPVLARLLLLGALLAIVGKIGLLFSGGFEGFRACYRGSVTGGACERVYESPMFGSSTTRIDKTIDFGERDWNLQFFNSARFNYYAWEQGSISRDRLPFSATWIGDLRDDVQAVAVNYVGEGKIITGGNSIQLPPAYDGQNEVRFQPPQGGESIEIHYLFDDGYRVGQESPGGPYAMLRVSRLEDGSPTQQRLTQSPPAAIRITSRVVDLLILLVLGGLCWFYLRLLNREVWFFLAIAGLATFVLLVPD